MISVKMLFILWTIFPLSSQLLSSSKLYFNESHTEILSNSVDCVINIIIKTFRAGSLTTILTSSSKNKAEVSTEFFQSIYQMILIRFMGNLRWNFKMFRAMPFKKLVVFVS